MPKDELINHRRAARLTAEPRWLDDALLAAITTVRDHARYRADQQDAKAGGMKVATGRDRWLQGRRTGQAIAYREVAALLGAILEGAEE